MSRLVSTLRKAIKINDITPALSQTWGDTECTTRCILATAYRLVNLFGWDDLIYGHITTRIPGTHDHILINPYGVHYTEVTASSLIKIDTSGNLVDPGTTKFPYQPTGAVIHTAIHAARPDLACLMHIHSRDGIALSTAVEEIQPICQAAVELGQISYHDYKGIIVDEADKRPLAKDFPEPSQTLIMRNHGLLTGGKTVEEAFNLMYFLHQTCMCYVDSGYLHNPVPRSTLISEELIKKSLVSSEECRLATDYGVQEFEGLARLLDYEGFETGYPYSEASKDLLKKNV